jgi:hypothetical protein
VLQITQTLVSTQQRNSLKVSITFFFLLSQKKVDINVSKDANWLKIYSNGKLYDDVKFLFSWMVCILVGLYKSILQLASKVFYFSINEYICRIIVTYNFYYRPD